MISKPGDLWTLFVTFGVLSFFSIGGAVSAVPEMHRIAVDTYHWMTDQQFADNFAIAMLSPGPNVLIVTLIGYQVAGIAGALIATFAMCGPAVLVAGIVGRTFERSGDAEWAIVIKTALVPLSIGLMGAASLILGPTSCRLVTGILLSFTGIGIASAGFPARFTGTVFCMTKTRASISAILPMDGMVGGSD